MTSIDSIPIDHQKRLRAILDTSWSLFVARFLGGRHPVSTEAPFQHHFANILATIGNLYCLSREDLFAVDLETRCEDIRGRTKFIDICCSFVNADVKCAIELKFKTARQSAQDYGRIDAYSDIEALELACQRGYDFGAFYMITDSTPYVRPSTKGVGTVFAMHDGHASVPGLFEFDSKGREHVRPHLRGAYRFHWLHRAPWYFLALPVERHHND